MTWQIDWESLCSRGPTHFASDYSLFCKKDDMSIIFIVLDVDVIVTGTDLNESQELKRFLYYQFKINDLERLWFSGIKDSLYKHWCSEYLKKICHWPAQGFWLH